MVPVAPEVRAAAVASPAGVLELDTHSSSKANPSESSPPPVSVAPMVSPFLCSNDSESDTEIPERHVSPTPHDAMLTRWRSRVSIRSSSPTNSTLENPTTPILPAPSAIVAPSSEFPLAPVVTPPEICRRRAILIRPGYTSHHSDHFTSGSSSSHSSSDHSSFRHSILGHSLPGHASPDITDADSSTPPRFVHPLLARTPRSESSARDSSFESYVGPSHKRCRSPAATVISSIHATRALVPSRDIESDATAVKVAVDIDVEARIYASTGMEVDVRIDVEDEVKDEVESSDRGTMEVGVDMVDGIDIPDGMLMPDAVERLEQAEEGLHDIYDHNEHYALWEVIEFGDSYQAPPEESGIGSASESSAKKNGRTVVITTEDMQKRRNDVKERTTLLLALPDEHQLRFDKYETAQELWVAILKTFGGNEATKKTKKNQLKQQYGNFKAEEIKQDDLNQKFFTSLAPEWLMYTIVWRNRDDLDTLSLDDEYNHLKVYEPKVQKKSESNSHNMAFISSANTSSGKGEVNTASIPTASTHVSPASADVAAASISHDTVCAYIASQSNGSQIKYEDINQIDEDDIEEMDIKECRAPRSQDRGRRENYKQGSKEEEPAPKDLMAIDGVEARLVEFKTQEIKLCEKIRGLEFDVESKNNKIKHLMNELEKVKKEKEDLDSKLTGFESALKDLDTLLGSQRSNKNKEGLGFSVVPPPTQHRESSDSIMSKPMIKFVKASDSPKIIKTHKVKTARKPYVRYAEMYRNTSKSPNVRGNQRNWNNLKSQQLGKDFLMKNKASFNCGHFDHMAYHCGLWVEKRKNWPKNTFVHKNVTPRTDLLKTGRTPITVNRTNMNGTQPKRTSFAKTAHSYVRRPFQRKSASTFTTGLGNKGKAVKASACWIWRPKQNTTEKGPNCNSVSLTFKKYQYIVTQGRLKDFKLKDDTNVLLRTPRQHNISIDLNNIVPHKDLTCLVAKASADESMLWHRRLGHLNFKTINKLVRHNLVKGLPSKIFENHHTCVAFLKGKQHKASCKTKLVNSVSKPLHTLHMDLFGPTFVSSLNHKWYCLVVTDDFFRFTWTFFLKTNDETTGILKNFITVIENLKDLKVKIIRCDNGGEFKNKEMHEFCTRKGIKREFSNARTPQQNGVAERRNRTLIEAARTMLADAKLPVTFWAKAVNTTCYVQNRVLVNKSYNKTPYELFNSRTPAIGFPKPYGYHVMILNTLDHLGKFDAKGDEGYFIGYSMSSKAFRVFNKRSRKVEENLHVDFLENKLIEKGVGPNWLFDIDTLTNSINYVPVVVIGTSSTNISAHIESSNNDAQDACNADAPESSGISNPTATSKIPPAEQMESLTVESEIPTVSSPVPTACLDNSLETTNGSRLISKEVFSQEETPFLDNILTLSNRFEDILGDTTNTVDIIGVEADLSNMESIIPASPTPTFRIHKDHPKSQIIGPVDTPVQTRHKSKEKEEHNFIATIHQKTTPGLLQVCLFLCFLSQEEPKKIFDALKDPCWVEAIQEELLQFKIQNVWILVDCPKRIYNLSDGCKMCFLYGTIDEEVYVMQPPGFQELQFPDRVYKVEKGKDAPGKDVELHLYRSMIGSLMYLTVSSLDIMFAICACARHQVTPKECHLHAVKRIFTYLKGHPKLGLWFPKESPFDLVAYSDSDYGGATQYRKSTTRGCQFLGRRLISWQCKKQTIMATSITEAEYVAAASGCG
uniref:Putative ribonuclease H-like domain-containing protein n=1 Tax=Tanacetum cinerariifolium TaxID=118510 RepID=A0A6L2LY26_TANCI|nr:putative ribonuclease H-like domain-containing protein [Tanacetum cinerariifolium]